MDRTRTYSDAIGALAFALGASLTLFACGGDAAGPDDDGVASVELSVATDTLTALDETVQIEAVAKDAQGSVLSGRTVSWSSSDDAVVTVSDEGAVTAVGNGDATVSATVDGVTGVVPLAVIQLASTITVTPGADTLATVGATRQYSAGAVDGNGNAVENARFLWQSSDPNVATVDTAGIATAVGAGTATITASAQGLPGHATLTVEQAVAGLGFLTGPMNATAGDAIDPAVQVEVLDASGNRVEDAEVAVTLALADNPGGATLSGTKTVNAVAGVASFSGLWLDRAATGYTLEASASNMVPATSGTFDIAAGEAAQVAFVTQPSNTHGNIPFSPAVQVAIQDAHGNTVTGATDSVTLRFDRNPNDASLLGTTTVAAVSGVATFSDLRIDLSGTDVALEAEAVGLPRAFSGPFDVVLDFVQVSAGESHTCAVTAMQQAYCWGDNGSGKLGDSTHVVRLRPVPVNGGHQFTAISAGWTHTCAVTVDQTVYCWGGDGVGQLGDGTGASPSEVPTEVAGAYSTVSAGYGYTCALGNAAGDAYCWGANDWGQLGTNSTAGTGVPTAVAGGLTFSTIDVGERHTCALTDGVSQQAYCWGSNEDGQLGNNDTTVVSAAGDSVPVAVSDTFGGLDFVDVSVGAGPRPRTCGAATDDWTYCWGRRADGVSSDSIPTRVTDATDFAEVGVGEAHNCAVRAGNARAYCWGDNGEGQAGADLAIGTVAPPSPVDLERLALDPDVLSVSAGARHSCAVTTDGVYCWGGNSRGQLGTGSTTQASTPIRIRQ